MVQVVENWADIDGVIRGTEPDAQVDGFVLMRVEVRGVSPVPGFPNLFAGAEGTTIAVAVPPTAPAIGDLTPGRTVRCRVRKATPTKSFADPARIAVSGP